MPIYRVFTIERLIEIFETNKLTMVRPHKWDDPLENYVFNKLSHENKGGKKPNRFEIYKNSLFGQCWTFEEESDAIWRIYAPNKNGVKVKSNVHDLLESLHLQLPHSAEISGYIARVLYKSSDYLEKLYSEIPDNFDCQSKDEVLNLVKTLTIKRPEFKHEKEVRLIYFEPWGNPTSDLKQFEIDPKYLFEELIFDPRMDDSIYKTFRDRMYSYYNYPSRARINKSILYTVPKFDK